MSLRFAVGILIAALFSGCGLPDRNLKEMLADKDVIGQWEMTREALGLLTRDKFQTDPSHLYKITFRPDGTCTFASVFDRDQGGNYVVAEGTWHLEHNTNGGSNVQNRNVIRMELHPRQGETVERVLNFDRDAQKHLLLWQFMVIPIVGSLSSTVAMTDQRIMNHA